MTESKEDVQPVDATLTAEPPSASPSEDWFLQTLVEYANAGLELGLTLMVGGTTVSGILINGKKYFEKLSAVVREVDGGNNEVMQTIADSFSDLGRIYDRPDDAAEDWILPPASFIHLKSAYVFTPGGGSLPNGEGVLWRGRINSVDGFTLGLLSPRGE
ncbi:gas vesicle accessory protein GvpU [Sphingomonas arenae]|uniref:gas vesicle accessory protein GvpU n=1 Tax=Sphingomonas arenae TaxID=2812555 RepID=UPI0019674CA6|nr:gas vesicle accessory protein GvpU [Sphingomonas arenae]